MVVTILILSVLTILGYLVFRPSTYWSKRNVPGNNLSVFADAIASIMSGESSRDMLQRQYKKYPEARFIGDYQFYTPVLILKSPELIKKICVKDFEFFLDHSLDVPDRVDKIWSKTLVGLTGTAWKEMRVTISPSFTSSKMKYMFQSLCYNCNSLVQYFLKTNKEVTEIDCFDAFTRLNSDIVANLAYGLEVNSLEERDNEFYQMTKEASGFSSPLRTLLVWLNQICPAIIEIFQIRYFGLKVKTYFLNLVKETMELREKKNIKRPDMLQILMEAQKAQQNLKDPDEVIEESFAAVEEYLDNKSGARRLTDMDIAAQLFIFMFGGFDTVTRATCMMAYELVANPDIQKRLIQEIKDNQPVDGIPTYDTIMKMTYLDMVVSEILRRWPPGIETDRLVTKPYTIEPELPNEKPVHLAKNDCIIIPIVALHHDPKYFPDPEKLDPERFSPENRKNIDPYTYLPFGVGPRNCIASRLAILEVKTIFFYLLSHFEIVPVERTKIPMKISSAVFSSDSKCGFHFGLRKI